MPHSSSYHQPTSTIQWQTAHSVFPNSGGRSQSRSGARIVVPIASQNGYNTQLSYPPQHRGEHFEGTTSNRRLLQVHNLPPGASFSSQPQYMLGKEYYNSQRGHVSQHESVQPRRGTQTLLTEPAEGHVGQGGYPPMGAGRCESPRAVSAMGDASGGREDSSTDRTQRSARGTPCTVLRRATHSSPTAYTSTTRGTPPERAETLKEQTPVANTRKSPIPLSTNSSKSSPPYTLSQRKQLRVEERSYLKEVKRSIAEGRVPQVRLKQNSSGNIVQYKAQFLNALKLAALALVPNADIDVKNTSTMQEIMMEVKRQFIIEAPLPDGMVEGFLQRLYKRNRLVYHRHWTLHGDQNKPDDCPSAAWLQLVDYWKSKEGSRECERNKANASAKKGAAVRNTKPCTISLQILAKLCASFNSKHSGP